MIELKNPQPENAWVSYALGINGFTGTLVPVILPRYFEGVAANGLSLAVARDYWAYTAALALIMVVLLAPFLGGFADRKGMRKRLLFITNLVGITATGLMILVGKGMWEFALVLYLVASVSVGCSLALYDSFLPHVAQQKEYNRPSCRGYFNGFAGTIATLVICLVIIMVILPDSDWGPRISFLLVAAWWAILSFFSLRYIPEPSNRSKHLETYGKSGINFYKTIREARRPLQMFLFLLAIGLSTGGMETIARMATSIGDEIGLGMTNLIIGIVLNNLMGMLAMLVIIRLTGRFSSKRIIGAGLVIYTFIAISGYFMFNKWIFWLLAALAGITPGMVAPLARSLFCSMIPRKRSGEYFGLYYAVLYLPAILGPIFFAEAGVLLGSIRLAILSILLLFILGRMVFTFVDDDIAEDTKSKGETPADGEQGVQSPSAQPIEQQAA